MARPRLLLGAILVGTALVTPAAAQTANDCSAARAYSEARRGVTLIVLREGREVCAAYAPGVAPDAAFELWSGAKSLVGLMAAAAADDGLLELDEAASLTLSEWRADPLKRSATLRQLLTMSAGLPSRVGAPPTYAEAVGIAFNSAPGAVFQYGPGPMQAFGEVMRRKLVASGRPGDPQAYLEARVLAPAGIEIAGWRKGADGLPLMPQGAALTAGDWAKVGELVRNGGKVAGESLVDGEALAELFRPGDANPGYGVTWWLPRAGPVDTPLTAQSDIGRRAAELPSDLVMAAGAGNQRLYVIPSLGLTIVRQASFRPADALRPGVGWSDADFLKLLLPLK